MRKDTSRIARRVLPLLLAAASLRAGGPGPRAWAAPDDEEVAVDAAAEAQNQAGVVFAQWTAEQFDQQIFHAVGGAQQARACLDSQSTLQLQELGRFCAVTAEQREKLRLAAALDEKRFFAEVETVRRHFLAVKNDQNAVQEIWQEIMPLQQRLAAGLSGEKSFFDKVVRTILTADQAAKRQALIEERRRFRYRATIEATLVEMDNQVALTAEQHAALVELLLKETKPPPTASQYDTYVVQVAIARLPEAKLKPLLGDRQWAPFDRRRQAFRGFEQFLVQQGLIEAAGEGAKTE